MLSLSHSIVEVGRFAMTTATFPILKLLPCSLKRSSPDDEDFDDLLINNLVFIGKRVACRKLEQLMMSSFQHTLLEHGSFHQMEGVEEYNATIKVSMGYAVMVGMCLSEEMAHTNGEVGRCLLGV